MPTLSFLQMRMGLAGRRTRAETCCAGLLLFASLVLGCGDQSLQPVPPPNQPDLYWALDLNHHGVVLDMTAPYDTLQLVATPRNFRGEPLTGLPAAQYVSQDPERLIVTPNGTLIALAPTTAPVKVLATLTTKNLKHVDSALVSIVDDPAPQALASFSIHPLPPDSAKLAAAAGGANAVLAPLDTLPVRAVTTGGEFLPVYTREPGGFLPVYFRSSDTTTAKLVTDFNSNVGVLRGFRRGTVNIYANTTVFGSLKADTLEYRFGWPVIAMARIEPANDVRVALPEPDITISAGGVVIWSFTRLDRRQFELQPFDITFADADLPNIAAVAPVFDHIATLSLIGPYLCVFDCTTSGNFVISDSVPGQVRYFPVPGTYEYHSGVAGFSGRVVVVDEQ